MMTDSPQTPKKPTLRLPKSERLCSTTAIDALFASGKGTLAYPLRLVSAPAASKNGAPTGNRFVIVVPKKRLRHAVDRVLMRRRIREAYRLNRLAPDGATAPLDLAFIYVANTPLDYQRVEAAMKRLLAALSS